MISQAGKRPGFAPRNWSGWVLVSLLWWLGKFPVRVGLLFTAPIGALAYRLMGRRVAVAKRNIERCFPELPEPEVEELLKANFRSLARTVFETAWCWGMSRKRFQPMAEIEGLEHLLEAEEAGKGVLLVTNHMTCLEIGGRVSSEAAPVTGVYRPLKNEVVEWYQNRGRLRYARAMVSKREMRSVIRYLRDGGILWYAPDQDFGPSQSIFVPFFGIQTATLEATYKLVALTDCAVVPMFPEFNPTTKKYLLRILPPLTDFASGGAYADLAKLNAVMEEQIRRVPDQYWWIHRRFKTRPQGEEPFYD